MVTTRDRGRALAGLRRARAPGRPHRRRRRGEHRRAGPRLVRARALPARRAARPGFGAGGRALLRVGDGFDAHLRPAARRGRPRRRDRAGPGRRARPLRARALHRARRARPTFDAGGSRDRAHLRALRLRRGRHAAARRADRRGRRVGPVLGRRQPPLQRRRGRLRRRREPRRGCARSARPTPTPTPPSPCPTARILVGRASATERSGHPGMALVRTSPEGAPDPSLGRRRHRARPRPRRLGGRPTSCSSRTAARSPPGIRAPAPEHAFMLARFDGAGRLDRSFGGQGVALTALPGHRDRARDRAGAPGRRQARRGRHRLRARAAARSAAAGRRGSRSPATWAATPPAGPPAPATAAPTHRARRRSAPFVSLPSRLSARRGRVRCACAACRPSAAAASCSLRRLRHEAPRAAARLAHVSIRGAARAPTLHREAAARARCGTRRRLRVRIEFAGRDAAGARRKVTRRVTLRRG